MRIVFAGTPVVAVPTLRALIEAGHEIVLVLTREDAPRGRKRVLTPSEVADAAGEHGLPVLKANRITERERSAIRAAGAELGVVVAYGALFDEQMLTAPTRGWINLHFSLLPKRRGAAPVQHTLLYGEEPGVSVFQLDPGVDSGPIWESAAFAVAATATSGAVLADFAERGTGVVLAAIDRIANGQTPTPQQGTVSYAPKLTSSDGELTSAATVVENLARFRAVTPEPGAYIADGDTRLKVHDAAVGTVRLPAGSWELADGRLFWGVSDGSLELLVVQPAGRAHMAAADWFRGRR